MKPQLLLLLLVLPMIMCQYEFLKQHSDNFHSNARMSKAGAKAGEMLRAVEDRAAAAPTQPQGLSENQDQQLQEVMNFAKDVSTLQDVNKGRETAENIDPPEKVMEADEKKYEKKSAKFQSTLGRLKYKQEHQNIEHPLSVYAYGDAHKPTPVDAAKQQAMKWHLKNKQFAYDLQAKNQQRNALQAQQRQKMEAQRQKLKKNQAKELEAINQRLKKTQHSLEY